MLKAKMPTLAEKRVSNGWSKLDLAREAKLTHSVVVRAEQELGTSPKTAKRIADALGVAVTDLFVIESKKGA